MVAYVTYGCITCEEGAGVSVRILLLAMLFASAFLLKEALEGGARYVAYIMQLAACVLLIWYGGPGFIPVAYFSAFEILRDVHAKPPFFFLLYVGVIFGAPVEFFVRFLALTVLLIAYLQHEFVVNAYEQRMLEDTIDQQRLKHVIESRTSEAKAELEKNKLLTENRILEEREELSQTLHDKLGHNINGSIYQLEACKVIMDQDPERARGMLQAVIDQLRTGMDEIRAILRSRRPEKKKMALLQLYELCADCNEKGVEAELSTEGDLAAIRDDVWELILDNAYEAVTNSMKYAKCERIDISIVVMKQMLRCSITDDGIGCNKIEDGMGLSGMRKRVREAGGVISFETHPGFRVDMMIPIA